MADVFANNVQSVEPVETADARMLVLAGAWRLRLDKKTGLLHGEHLTAGAGTTPGAWVPASFLISSFWATNTEIASALAYAWRHRLTWFVPSAEVCYPKAPPKRYRDMSATDRWAGSLRLAAARRLGGRKDTLNVVKRFTSQLWNFLVDRETLKLCHAYFGRKANPKDYNFTVRRRKDLQARFAETPHLAPLIGTYLKSSPVLKHGRRRIPQDVLVHARASVFPAAPNREAMSPAAWRLFANMTPTTVAALWGVAGRDAVSPGTKLVPMLNLVSRAGVLPPLTFLKRLIEELGRIRSDLSAQTYTDAQESLVRFIRLAGQQALIAKKRGRLKHFLSGEFLLSLDWFRQREDYGDYHIAPANVPKNATWASIMRAQHTWHAERATRERLRREADAKAQRKYLEKMDARTWVSALPACEVKGASVVPLVSGKALREEGDRMEHCVGAPGYIRDCEYGTSRIFSIRYGDESATLELRKSGTHTWQVRQVFGPDNWDVSKPVRSIAKTIAKMYEAAAREARSNATPAYKS